MKLEYELREESSCVSVGLKGVTTPAYMPGWDGGSERCAYVAENVRSVFATIPPGMKDNIPLLAPLTPDETPHRHLDRSKEGERLEEDGQDMCENIVKSQAYRSASCDEVHHGE